MTIPIQTEATRRLTVNRSARRGRAMRPAVAATLAAGLASSPLGLIGWIWAGDWRWAVTGILVMVIAAIITAVLIATSPDKGGSI
ncbi:MAG: hypothetical protein ACRDTT_29260 [Pseudonocardiaceae bacterium]